MHIIKLHKKKLFQGYLLTIELELQSSFGNIRDR